MVDYAYRYGNPYGPKDHKTKFLPDFNQRKDYGYTSEDEMASPLEANDGFGGYMPAEAPMGTGHEQHGVGGNDYEMNEYGNAGEGNMSYNPNQGPMFGNGGGTGGIEGMHPNSGIGQYPGKKPVKTAPDYMRTVRSGYAAADQAPQAPQETYGQYPGGSQSPADAMGAAVSGMYGQGLPDEEIMNRARMMQRMGG